MSLLSEVEQRLEKEILEYQKEVLEGYVKDRNRAEEQHSKAVANVTKVSTMTIDQFKNSSFYKWRH